MRLLVSGSPHPESANSRLLKTLPNLDKETEHRLATYLDRLPVFQPALDRAPLPEAVVRWRRDAAAATEVCICTPAYLHNMPGVLKNALDWLASSGELDGKATIALTFTPASPRGDRALQSLKWSLSALNARVLMAGSLYQSDAQWDETGGLQAGELRDTLLEIIRLFRE